MMKKSVIPGVLSGIFLTIAIIFWYVVRRFYDDPFSWISFKNSFDYSLIFLILSIIGLAVVSALLSIIRPKSKVTLGTYTLGSLLQFIFLPFDPFLIFASLFFFYGFWSFERETNKIFHQYIKIHFADTYWKTIPGLITCLTLLIAVVCYQSSIDKAKTLRITIPEQLIEQTVDMISGPQVKGESTSLAQADDSSVEQIIEEQLQKYGIKDPAQRELIKEQVKQMYGIDTGTEPLTATVPPGLEKALEDDKSGLLDQLTEKLTGEGTTMNQNLQQEYRRLLIDQTKKEVERQIDSKVSQYRPFLPIMNTIAIFFLLSIINLPIVLVTIPIVSSIMYLMKRYGLISIVSVKMDVERIAW